MGTACSAENREKLQKKALDLIPGKKPAATNDESAAEKEPLQAAADAAKEAGKDGKKEGDNPLAALGIDASALGSLGDLGNLGDALKGEGISDLLTQAQDMLKGAQKETGDAASAENRAGETTDAAAKTDGGVNLGTILKNDKLKEALKGVDLENPEKLAEVMENDQVKEVMGNLKGVDQGAALKTVQQLFDKLPDNISSLIPGSSDKPAGSENATNAAADAVAQAGNAIGNALGGDKK